jgi:hypothetical protein
METIEQARDALFVMSVISLAAFGYAAAMYSDARHRIQARESFRVERLEKLYASARLIAAMATPETVARYYAARIPSAVWA